MTIVASQGEIDATVVQSRLDQHGRLTTPMEGVPIPARSDSSQTSKSAGGSVAAGGVLVPSMPPIQRFSIVLVLTLMSLGMTFLIFPRIGWWPLAYVCLAPWLLGVSQAARAPHAYICSYLFGAGYFALNAHWLLQVTPPGYIALCLYFGIFFPLATWVIRHGLRRRNIPLAFTAPIVWTAVEYLRSIGVLGFPMLLLGHSQYEQLSVIQISDLVGAYGVTFMIVMVNGMIADLMSMPIVMDRRESRPKLSYGILATACVVSLTLIYGSAQKSDKYLEDGPVISVVQHDIPLAVAGPVRRFFHSIETYDAHISLTRQAAESSPKPDLVLLPESMILGCYPNYEFLGYSRDELQFIYDERYAGYRKTYLPDAQRFSRQVRDEFQKLSTESGSAIVLGASGLVSRETTHPTRVDAYNSAYLFLPGKDRPVARYSKRHLVLFGEYVPFRYSYPEIYTWLNDITPYGGSGRHYSLSAGEAPVVFEIPASNGRLGFRAAAPICFEEIMPYVAREFTLGDGDNGKSDKNIDVLLCLSNDGWFFHSTELEQHLAAGVFRAVENRIAVARSVNTGASAIIDPNGRVRTRVGLTDKQIAKLGAVEKILSSMLETARRIPDKSDQTAFNKIRSEVANLGDGELRNAWTTLGSEFGIFADRIVRLIGGVHVRNPTVEQSVTYLCDQLSEDIEMTNRWRDMPWTGPGFASAKTRVDSRLTFYTSWGDWFPRLLLVLSALGLLDWFGFRIRNRRGRRGVKEDAST